LRTYAGQLRTFGTILLLTRSGKKVELVCKLVTAGDKPMYHYLRVEKESVTPLGFTGNLRRAVCTINEDVSIQCSLMPSGTGSYYISLNKEIRTRLRISPGDSVRIRLEKDESKYGLPMPEELAEVLRQDPEGDKLFHSLTNGRQRSVIYYVSKAKDIDRRIHNALIMIEHIKKNEGKINERQLYEELKRPIL